MELKKEIFKRIIKFQIVAWGGTVVNLGVLWILKGKLGINVVIAGACAIELAIIHNFTWHFFVTWKDRVKRNLKDYIIRLLKYNAVTASIDFTVNLGILWLLTTYFDVHYLLADIIGMIAGPLFKFIANEFLVFRRKKHYEESSGEGK
ncbi:GtrA family protein [bacterium]|nr:GtrA family protein [bacterium]